MKFQGSDSASPSFYGDENRSEPESEDYIGRLPDDVIQHILSFLQTKHVVATSSLSKRWQNAWIHVPTLSFDNSTSDLYDRRFSKFVHRVLKKHHSPSLKKFHLKCSPYSDFIDIEKLIGVAIHSCPTEFKLMMFSCRSRRFKLPHSLFRLKTLVVLKLKGEGILLDLRNSRVNLPNLKILHLLFVHYMDNKSLPGFLSRCSALEEIHLRRCFYNDAVTTLTIDVPTLKRLTLVSTKTDNPSKIKLQIKAPALEHLELRVVQIQKLDIQDFPEIVEATMDFHESVVTTKILPAVQNVKFLFVDNLPQCVPREAFRFFTKYNRLVRLEFTIKSHFWDVLMFLLEKSPNIEDLTLLKVSQIQGEDDLSWSTPSSVPSCLSQKLERFCIHGFSSSSTELELVGYILMNAQALRQVTIQTFHQDSESKDRLLDQISAFQKCPEKCKIEIV